MASSNARLGLRPGEWVQVRSKEEILATLDRDGTSGALPYMPEMLQYCGRRLRVYKRADKTCDTLTNTGGRRLHDTVHLDGIRCDGSAHGGCHASCLMFWRESWLKRADAPEAAQPVGQPAAAPGCTVAELEAAAVVDRERQIYRCQITQLKAFTEPLPWWNIGQYWSDFRKNKVPIKSLLAAFCFSAFRKLTELGVGYRFLVAVYESFQRIRGGTPFPLRSGTLERTPTQELGLQPGEWVRIKTYPEILATLDRNNRNRGMSFDTEMVGHCGKTYRVTKRVQRILDERTGKMVEFQNPCIILDGVFCCAQKSKYRLFCPRGIPSYWREIWLERASPDGAEADSS